MSLSATMSWDPWDRILAAQARLEGYSLISADKAFDTAGVERIW
jgi:PIN domain nuclease of toxin-antitoxin system